MSEGVAYVGLGANLGDAEKTCRAAVRQLDEHPSIRVQKCSNLYRTTPVDAPGPDYCNGIIEILTGLSAARLLDLLLQVEAEFGRTRSAWHAPRTLDLDLIAYRDERMVGSQLIVPHPRAHQRAFVLVPLCELNPETMLGDPIATTLEPARLWLARQSAAELDQVARW